MKKIEKTNLIENFIVNNGLTFEKGERNSNSVILSGYALFIKLNDVDVITEIISKICYPHWDFKTEFKRVFDFAEANNYGDWWKSDSAKKQYKF